MSSNQVDNDPTVKHEYGGGSGNDPKDLERVLKEAREWNLKMQLIQAEHTKKNSTITALGRGLKDSFRLQ